MFVINQNLKDHITGIAMLNLMKKKKDFYRVGSFLSILTKNHILIFGSVVLLLMAGCMKDADGNHIGGLEAGPAVIRYLENTDPGAAQPYVYPARWLLGDLKRQMQLAGIKWGQSNIINQDGVKLHAQSNQYGLADIDEIWIDMSELSGKAPQAIKIVAFDIYFKEHNTYFPVESIANNVSRPIYYLVSEPLNTTGGGLILSSVDNGFIPHDIALANYYYNYDHPLGDTSKYSGGVTRTDTTSIGYFSWVQTFEAYWDDGVDQYHYDVFGTAAATEYGMYAAPNTCFNYLMPDKYKYSGGYMGKVSMTLLDGTTIKCVVPAEVPAVLGVRHNSLQMEAPSMSVSKPKEFVLGFYGIGSLNKRFLYPLLASWSEGYEEHGESPNSDVGGYTLVFTMSNGDTKVYDFPLTFSYTGWPDSVNIFSATTVLFNPSTGVINQYELAQEDNPFYKGMVMGVAGNLVDYNEVMVKDVTETPVKTIDVYADYRNGNYIIQ